MGRSGCNSARRNRRNRRARNGPCQRTRIHTVATGVIDNRPAPRPVHRQGRTPERAQVLPTAPAAEVSAARPGTTFRNARPRSVPGLGRAKTPALAPHVEISLSNCISNSQIILHTRGSMPCRRIVFFTFRGCMSFYTWGNSGLEPYSGSGNQLSRNRQGPPTDLAIMEN